MAWHVFGELGNAVADAGQTWGNALGGLVDEQRKSQAEAERRKNQLADEASRQKFEADQSQLNRDNTMAAAGYVKAPTYEGDDAMRAREGADLVAAQKRAAANLPPAPSDPQLLMRGRQRQLASNDVDLAGALGAKIGLQPSDIPTAGIAEHDAPVGGYGQRRQTGTEFQPGPMLQHKAQLEDAESIAKLEALRTQGRGPAGAGGERGGLPARDRSPATIHGEEIAKLDAGTTPGTSLADYIGNVVNQNNVIMAERSRATAAGQDPEAAVMALKQDPVKLQGMLADQFHQQHSALVYKNTIPRIAALNYVDQATGQHNINQDELRNYLMQAQRDGLSPELIKNLGLDPASIGSGNGAASSGTPDPAQTRALAQQVAQANLPPAQRQQVDNILQEMATSHIMAGAGAPAGGGPSQPQAGGSSSPLPTAPQGPGQNPVNFLPPVPFGRPPLVDMLPAFHSGAQFAPRAQLDPNRREITQDKFDQNLAPPIAPSPGGVRGADVTPAVPPQGNKKLDRLSMMGGLIGHPSLSAGQDVLNSQGAPKGDFFLNNGQSVGAPDPNLAMSMAPKRAVDVPELAGASGEMNRPVFGHPPEELPPPDTSIPTARPEYEGDTGQSKVQQPTGKALLDDPEFQASVKQVADQVGMKPEWLTNIMGPEAGMDPTAQNHVGNQDASGLLQWTKGTIDDMVKRKFLPEGTTTATVRQMPATEQMRVLAPAYFKAAGVEGKIKSQRDAYAAIFYPAMLRGNWSPDTVLGSEPGSSASPKQIYDQNPGIAKYAKTPGVLTVGDFDRYVDAKFPNQS